jgi:dihydroorotate dehydrogenase electron transfer subunit
MAHQEQVKILENKKIGANYFKLIFRSAKIAKSALPGQFVDIKVDASVIPLLRRPLSIHSVKGINIALLYEVLGKGTEILSGRKPGEYLDIIGPLGNGFSVGGKMPAMLVAGGMGVAPLVFLAEKLKSAKRLVLIGAKTKKQILCVKEFEKAGCEVKVATDDGSSGFKGRVTDLLERVLADNPKAGIFSCGPKPMLKAICALAGTNNIRAEISLEEHMACGIGACLGCVVDTKEGMKRVCKEGPVFEAGKIIWR